MTPNPLVAMAASAPATRYAPREMPRVGSRSEGRSFEERLNLAEAKPRNGSRPGRAAETKPQEKPVETAEKPQVAPEEAALKSPETKQASESGSAVPETAPVPTESAAVMPVAVQAAPVSELASVAVMSGQAPVMPPAEAEADVEAPLPQGTTPQGTASPVAVSPQAGGVNADPALNGAIAQALAPQVKPDAKKATDTTEPTLPAPEAEGEEAEAVAETKPPVPVKPVARQAVPSSLDGLHAVKGLTSLKESLDGAKSTETRPAPVRPDASATPATLEEMTASLVEETAPEPAAVKPWELSEPVRPVAAPATPKAEVATVKAEPVPVKDALVRTFVQVQKTPDRPAELRLQLNPEHLGRMDVRVQAHEGAVSAVIRVDHGAARDLVESQLAALRTTLADQGIKVDRLEVSVNNQGPRDQQQTAAGFDMNRQGFGQDGQRDASGQHAPSNAPHTGWDGWSLEDALDASLIDEHETANAGFDAQA